MANEIAVAGSISFAPTSAESVTIEPSALTITMSGTKIVSAIQSIGTSEETVTLGEIATPHWSFFKNLDATNYLQLYTGSGGTPFVKLLAGKWCIIPLDPGVSLYAKANSAACRLQYCIAEA